MTAPVLPPRNVSTVTGKRGSEIRWAFLQGLDIGADGDPYLDRLRVIQTPWFGLYLHHIHRPDQDRDPHDHPWWFASVVLAGAYSERVWPDKRRAGQWHERSRPRWSLCCLNRKSAHLISTIEKPLWTLVITGPKRAGWGFWRDGQFTSWREYVR